MCVPHSGHLLVAQTGQILQMLLSLTLNLCKHSYSKNRATEPFRTKYNSVCSITVLITCPGKLSSFHYLNARIEASNFFLTSVICPDRIF